MKTATLLLALVASANAAVISPGASYNLDYTATTSPSTALSGHIASIKSQLGANPPDFTGAYNTYTSNIKTAFVDAVSNSDILSKFNAENSDAGASFSAQVTKYLSEVEVRLMNKPSS